VTALSDMRLSPFGRMGSSSCPRACGTANPARSSRPCPHRRSLRPRPSWGDRVQLQQVLLNLIMNGVEAMREVKECARELTVSTAFAQPGGSVLVAVEDTGTGLDPAVAERMSQPYFTTKPDGLGMGRAICRSNIEAHGGRLWASPRAPHGADVRFTIPLWVRR
jgi:signal transduction histidine kinase